MNFKDSMPSVRCAFGHWAKHGPKRAKTVWKGLKIEIDGLHIVFGTKNAISLPKINQRVFHGLPFFFCNVWFEKHPPVKGLIQWYPQFLFIVHFILSPPQLCAKSAFLISRTILELFAVVGGSWVYRRQNPTSLSSEVSEHEFQIFQYQLKV